MDLEWKDRNWKWWNIKWNALFIRLTLSNFSATPTELEWTLELVIITLKITQNNNFIFITLVDLISDKIEFWLYSHFTIQTVLFHFCETNQYCAMYFGLGLYHPLYRFHVNSIQSSTCATCFNVRHALLGLVFNNVDRLAIKKKSSHFYCVANFYLHLKLSKT